MRQAVPATEPEERVEAALNEWKRSYVANGTDLTEPFPHIVETLLELKEKGMRLGVLSNKFEDGVTQLVNMKLPSVFDVVRGESSTCLRKPNPACLLDMMDQLGVSPDEVLYLGDSGGDMITANRAGAYAVGVSWGYQPIDLLWENGARAVIDDPAEILDIIAG